MPTPKNKKVLTKIPLRFWCDASGDVRKFSNNEGLTLSALSVKLKMGGSAALFVCTRTQLPGIDMPCACWVLPTKLKPAMTPFLSPLKWVEPTCRERKAKRLQVGRNPSAISSTHTPAWLLNEWKWVSCRHSAGLPLLPYRPGCTLVRRTCWMRRSKWHHETATAGGWGARGRHTHAGSAHLFW